MFETAASFTTVSAPTAVVGRHRPAIARSDLEAILELPEHLRTGQWYDDLQHCMLVVIFRNVLLALRQGQHRIAEYLLDVATVYLYVHFLCEEEGMTYSTAHGFYESERLFAHYEAHIKFLERWKQTVLFPHKRGEIDEAELYARVAGYYGAIIGHIDESDQGTYGVKSQGDKDHLSEIVDIALSRLPLSPFMPGAIDVVRIADREAAEALDVSRFAAPAREALGHLSADELAGRLPAGAPHSLRARIYGRLGVARVGHA